MFYGIAYVPQPQIFKDCSNKVKAAENPTVNWTREQTVIALSLYCQIPFNLVSSRHPLIIYTSSIIGRSIAALKMKIGNFGSFDPDLMARGIVGLTNSSKLDREVWDYYSKDWGKLAIDSSFTSDKLELSNSLEPVEEDQDFKEGLTKLAVTKQRINQNFFRSMVLSSYESRCCITDIAVPALLIASHIKPWALDLENRMNPKNGLCLNALHDRAFDKGLISIDADYKIQVSQKLLDSKEAAVSEYFAKYHSRPIRLPSKFHPSKDFLAYHTENIFQG